MTRNSNSREWLLPDDVLSLYTSKPSDASRQRSVKVSGSNLLLTVCICAAANTVQLDSCAAKDIVSFAASPNGLINTYCSHLLTPFNNKTIKWEEIKSIKQNLYARLDELASLQAGWDGENSVPLNKEVIKLVTEVINKAPEDAFKHWVLFADGRGYAYWDYTNGKDIAGMTITNDSFVYFVKKAGKLEKRNENRLDIDAIVGVLQKANSLA